MDEMLSYLAGLEANNNREWFHAHPQEKKEAIAAFHRFLQELLFSIAEFDEWAILQKPAELMYRIPRDMRIANQPTPYNPTLRAHIGPRGKQPFPIGYYLCLGPSGNSFLGSGFTVDYDKKLTTRLRDHILLHGEELRAILEAPSFQKNFVLKGTALKTTPRGYDASHPQADLLRYKCMYAECSLSDQTIRKKDFVRKAAELFRAVRPLTQFLNAAIGDYEW